MAVPPRARPLCPLSLEGRGQKRRSCPVRVLTGPAGSRSHESLGPPALSPTAFDLTRTPDCSEAEFTRHRCRPRPTWPLVRGHTSWSPTDQAREPPGHCPRTGLRAAHTHANVPGPEAAAAATLPKVMGGLKAAHVLGAHLD